MEICLVGGAVRDELLGRPVKERDWVVVGATPADLEARGFRAVGRDFPVFLHPETNEEHALARLERKVAPGYRGFTTDFAPSVTLEQDLARRDLTINAMARRADGTLVDPYGGRADLAAGRVRFIGDPDQRIAEDVNKFIDGGGVSGGRYSGYGVYSYSILLIATLYARSAYLRPEGQQPIVGWLLGAAGLVMVALGFVLFGYTAPAVVAGVAALAMAGYAIKSRFAAPQTSSISS